MVTSLLPWLLVLQVGAPRVQRGVVVQPDTVTVGDPFRVAVRIRAPRGAIVEFPTAPDSGAVVEALDPLVVTPGTDTSMVEQTAVYRLAAWDVGTLAVPLADILIRVDGVERHIALADVRVQVRSVLPADSTLHVPRPPRDVMDIPRPWWWWALAALAAALLIGVWWWRRSRRRARVARIPLDPLVVAEAAFQRIESLALVAAGERARHAALMVEVLRDYLAAVEPRAHAALTTTELLAALRSTNGISVNRLATLLTEIDLVKFAGRTIAAERATAAGGESRALVRGIHQARHPAPERKAA